MIDLLMVQGAMHPSPTTMFAKVNLPNTFSGIGKARKLTECLLKIENHFDVQMLEEDDKVSIVVIIFKDCVFC